MEQFESLNVTEKPASTKMSTISKILIAGTGGVGIGLTIICASFVAPAFRRFCLPYVPATTEQIKNVISYLPKPSSTTVPNKLLDIGSGDGRIVIAAAKEGIPSDGVELNPWLVMYSRLASLRHGVSKNTRFFRQDLWKFNIQPYNYVVIFGVEQMMKELEQKLIAEAPNNTKIIACRFPLPHLRPQHTIEDGVNTVWFYDLSNENRRQNL